MDQKPLFTVILETYYRPKLLKQAVDAIRRQTYDNLEIILINNGATSETIEYLYATENSDERVILSHNSDELKRTMWDYVAIVRTTKRLERAQTRIQNLSKEIEEYYWNFKVEPSLLQLRNLIQVAELIVKCALQRKESRGLHYILDHPEKNTNPKNTYLQKLV